MTPLHPPAGAERQPVTAPSFEVGRQLGALWQRKWWISLITALAIAGAYYWTSQ